jgi:ABC-2 type transport system permease protein
MNFYAIRAIYGFELERTRRTLFQSVAAPVMSTSLYFIVFGSAIGGRISTIDGVSYGAFIVPGLILLTALSESVSNASFGMYLPRFTGTIYELLSAPVSVLELLLGFIGASATKSLLLGALILATARFFAPFDIAHPFWAFGFFLLVVITFSLLGFIIGILADGFEKLQILPMMVISPLTFLGGTFYSIDMLPSPWRSVALVNPIVYLVSGLRWAFYGKADVALGASLAVTLLFAALCLGVIFWIFRTGYRLRA